MEFASRAGFSEMEVVPVLPPRRYMS